MIAQATQEQEKENLCLNKEELKIENTINPSIKEIERFLLFLNDRFELGLDFKDITILISQAHRNTKGYYSPNGFMNTKGKLKAIVLNTIHLQSHPYETIAHELGHYYNSVNKIKDYSSNQYHNKHFKEIAEKLLLEVERLDNKGYAYTRETPAFLEMLKEFKPSPKAFHINQIINDKVRATTRNFKATCSCGYIIRCGDRSLKATCNRCNTEFKFEDLPKVKIELK